MKNRPNQLGEIKTILDKIVEESLNISKVKNCTRIIPSTQSYNYFYVQRGHKCIIIILEDNAIFIDLNNLTIDSRIGTKYWDEFKTIDNNVIKIQLADPDSINRLARIFRAVKPCWW